MVGNHFPFRASFGSLCCCMLSRHVRTFPRYSFYCVLAGLAALYLFAAMVLVPAKIFLLPSIVTADYVRYKGAALILIVAVPAAIYLICWKGSDFFAYFFAPAEIDLAEHGLSIGPVHIAFSDITRLRHRHARNHVLLALRDGRTVRLRLALWADADELLAQIDEAVSDALWQEADRRVQAGETVPFGALGLNAQGLVHKGQLLAWSHIDTIRTQSDAEGMDTDETLVIVADGKTRKIDRSKIDNEPVLMACLARRLPAT